MPLTDEQRKNLRNLIQNTFTEQQLKDILTENEQTLRGNLYDVVEGTTYQSKLINLVKHLDQNDLINTFVEILSNENQNFASQIQSFITQENTSDQQNTNNIISYLFFIVEPKSSKEFFIKAEFVQFLNNKIESKINNDYIELSEEQESQIYSDSQIIDVVYETIEKIEKQKKIVLDCPLIIELFVPISLLGIDLNKIPKKYKSHRVPISKNYSVNMRSYDRFFTHNINDASTVFYREKWKELKQLIDQSHNTQQFIKTLSSSYYIIKDSVTNSRQSRKKTQKIFNDILRKGFPLCLWTRYEDINTINEINNYLERILKIDDNHYPGYCKFYKILRNIHAITDSGYNLGVLFDHDKIPTAANQLISPNMARKV